MQGDPVFGIQVKSAASRVGPLVKLTTDSSGRITGIATIHPDINEITDFVPHPRLPILYLLRSGRDEIQLSIVAVGTMGQLSESGRVYRVRGSNPERAVVAITPSGGCLVFADSQNAYFMKLNQEGTLADVQPKKTQYTDENSLQTINPYPKIHIAPNNEFVCIHFIGNASETNFGGLSVLDLRGKLLFNSSALASDVSEYFTHGVVDLQITPDSRFFLALLDSRDIAVFEYRRDQKIVYRNTILFHPVEFDQICLSRRGDVLFIYEARPKHGISAYAVADLTRGTARRLGDKVPFPPSYVRYLSQHGFNLKYEGVYSTGMSVASNDPRRLRLILGGDILEYRIDGPRLIWNSTFSLPGRNFSDSLYSVSHGVHSPK